MDASIAKLYSALNEAQTAIRKADAFGQALREGARVIVESCQISRCVVWYGVDGDGDGVVDTLHPIYFIGPKDITDRVHAVGEGVAGRVSQTQTSERYFAFTEGDDSGTVADFCDIEVNSMICVPFSLIDGTVGCIQFVNKNDGSPFTQEEADICEIASLNACIKFLEKDQAELTWKHDKVIMHLSGITREYPSGDTVVKVLKGIDLDVFEGELLVLLGESGCGKTTLLNIIGGMDYPTGGTFEFLGEEHAGASQKQLTEYRRENIGFVFQSYNLMPHLTARQNLELAASLVPDPLSVDEALEIVKLSAQGKNYPNQLSGGQQQRVSIARALMKKPRIVLADEPTGALDCETSREVLGAMEAIVAAGTTMVIVTHNEEVCRMADRVVRMRAGRVYEVNVNSRKAHASELSW